MITISCHYQLQLACNSSKLFHCSSQADSGKALVEVPPTPPNDTTVTTNQLELAESIFTTSSQLLTSKDTICEDCVTNNTAEQCNLDSHAAKRDSEEDTVAGCSNVSVQSGVGTGSISNDSKVVCAITESDLLKDNKKSKETSESLKTTKISRSSPPPDAPTTTVPSSAINIPVCTRFPEVQIHSELPQDSSLPTTSAVYSHVPTPASLTEHTSTVNENKPSYDQSVEVVKGPNESTFPNQPPHPVSTVGVVYSRLLDMKCSTSTV